MNFPELGATITEEAVYTFAVSFSFSEEDIPEGSRWFGKG